MSERLCLHKVISGVIKCTYKKLLFLSKHVSFKVFGMIQPLSPSPLNKRILTTIAIF